MTQKRINALGPVLLISSLAILAILAIWGAYPLQGHAIGAGSASIRSVRQGAKPDYSTAIAQAKKIAQEVYEHGFPGPKGPPLDGKSVKAPGFSVAIAVAGKVVLAEGFGYSDLEQHVPVTPQTKFRIGSVSKPLTAAALMLLCEQGKFDLDAPIQRYVPSFPDKGAVITTRQLAGHQGGIRHYRDDEPEAQAHYKSVVESLSRFKDDPLVAPPGTKYSYSSYGFVLISAAMESASGENFLTLMQKSVFDPLGLRDTTPDENRPIVEHRSRWYSLGADGKFENSEYADLSYKWAGGGFLSTPSDLVRFGSALLQPGFMKADSLKLLFTSQPTRAGAETHYGLGWQIYGKGQFGPERTYAHSGGSVGGTTWLIIYPDQQLVAACAINTGELGLRRADLRQITEPILNQIEGLAGK